MKYSVDIEIDKPVHRVVELFDSVDNMYKWMDGLEKFEPLSGTPGQVGATSKLTFKMKRGTLEMIETITVKNLPAEFSGTYDAKGVHNIVRNFFHESPGGKTRYEAEHEFQFKGFMKVIAFMMPGMFKKQSLKHMADFKRFVESQN